MKSNLIVLAALLIVRAEANDAGIAIPPKPAASDGQIVVFEGVVTGWISPQNGVCGAPDAPGTENYAAWKAAEFTYSRTHDLNICPAYGMPYVIDVPWIFRDFDADENDPKNYDFACTDKLLGSIRAVGVEPFYRLGAAFEHYQIRSISIPGTAMRRIRSRAPNRRSGSAVCWTRTATRTRSRSSTNGITSRNGTTIRSNSIRKMPGSETRTTSARLASGASLAHAVCHMTDKSFMYTAYDPEPNADGSIDLMMYPCSFVYIESQGARK